MSVNKQLLHCPGYTVQAFKFPDGQPHVAVKSNGGKVVTVEATLQSGDHLLELLLLNDALWAAGFRTVNLTLSYLLGSRMDRPMPAEDGFHNPWTLAVIANAVHSQRWDGVRVFDPHSTESLGQLHALPIWANRQVKAVLGLLNVSPVIVAPDEGARERVNRLMYLDAIPPNTPVVQMQKVRNPSTGALSGFQFEAEPGAVLRNATALIIDDLCDGGGTFEGVAHLLREAGAAKVLLYVSHGVFSKGLPLKGIDHVFTTDSYKAQHKAPEGYLTIFPWGTGV